MTSYKQIMEQAGNSHKDVNYWEDILQQLEGGISPYRYYEDIL